MFLDVSRDHVLIQYCHMDTDGPSLEVKQESKVEVEARPLLGHSRAGARAGFLLSKEGALS